MTPWVLLAAVPAWAALAALRRDVLEARGAARWRAALARWAAEGRSPRDAVAAYEARRRGRGP